MDVSDILPRVDGPLLYFFLITNPLLKPSLVASLVRFLLTPPRLATPMEPPPPPAAIPREAWEGCSVLLDINDGDRLAFFRLTPAASVLPSPPHPP